MEKNENPLIEHVTPKNGNVFADLGFEAEEAAKLLADADRIIDEKLENIQAATTVNKFSND